MTSWKAIILGAAVVFISTVTVCADMVGTSCVDARMTGYGISTRAEANGQPAATSEPVRLGSLDMTLPSEIPTNSTDAEQPPAVRSLPPAPGSLTLFLSALGGMGAWQLGRSARRFHLGFIPDWYHTGGPVQVGHVSAINPDLTAPAVINLFHEPAGEQPLRLLLRRALPLRFRTQCTPALATPRAPPLCCL